MTRRSFLNLSAGVLGSATMPRWAAMGAFTGVTRAVAAVAPDTVVALCRDAGRMALAAAEEQDWQPVRALIAQAQRRWRASEDSLRAFDLGLHEQGSKVSGLGAACALYFSFPTTLNALTLCARLADAGNYDQARAGLVQIQAAPDRDRCGQALPDWIDRVAVQEWELTITLDQQRFASPGRERFRARGYYQCFYPTDTAYQSCLAVEAVGAAREEYGEDAVGNRLIRLWPRDAGRCDLLVRFTRQPVALDMSPLNTPDIDWPVEVRPFLSTTNHCRPDTPQVREILATGLLAADKVQTINNILTWFDQNVAYGGGGDSEETLRTRSGACGSVTAAQCALFRSRGVSVPANGVVGLLGIDHQAKPWWHTVPAVYVPGSGWVPLIQHPDLETGRLHVFPSYLVLVNSRPDIDGQTNFGAEMFFDMHVPDEMGGNLKLRHVRSLLIPT